MESGTWGAYAAQGIVSRGVGNVGGSYARGRGGMATDDLIKVIAGMSVGFVIKSTPYVERSSHTIYLRCIV